jgi:hypothetical protein
MAVSMLQQPHHWWRDPSLLWLPELLSLAKLSVSPEVRCFVSHLHLLPLPICLTSSPTPTTYPKSISRIHQVHLDPKCKEAAQTKQGLSK